MKFSEMVWKRNQDLYNKIINTNFNKELMDGSLDKKKFAYYIEQDSLYLKYYSKALAIISSKIHNVDYALVFLKSSINSYIVEEEIVHKYFRDTFKFENTNKITTANLGYTSFLINTAHTEAFETAASSILPCFWIYNELGKYIKANAEVENNPYKKWIDTYADEEFSKATEYMIKILDNLYDNASDVVKEKMIAVFDIAFIWEYRFWNDAYNLDDFHNV
ncbi:putative transcription activator [Brachyspira intermedia PWS/A]|uniref:Putative transcription activator n=1 Tax=Brachyspira intermedia (strain ATCC 51140 / PWS/A) TaxID=1045858 RepID=G0EKQ6_BRAIP|nr:TenA family protein [Brachyspira intermedia]AEM21364.1 putative transcription activator [Brachyspira intermedia PWS/A]